MQKELVEGIKAIKWKHRYMLKDGTTVVGVPCTQISQTLRDEGWRRVPRIDSCDLRAAGFKTVFGRYANGANKTQGKDCEIVVLD